ncbi:MAG TPA: helix-turn-helix domain-containing protein [bacterium]|nr:helix-turn-helix domain-containing protein [bacterium]
MAKQAGTFRLMTADEVAEILRVSRQSIYRWADNGTLPCIKVGRAVRFDPEAIRLLVRNGLSERVRQEL